MVADAGRDLPRTVGCSSVEVIVARCLVVNSSNLIKATGRSQPATGGALQNLESQG